MKVDDGSGDEGKDNEEDDIALLENPKKWEFITTNTRDMRRRNLEAQRIAK